MTLTQKQETMAKAFKKSMNGKLTFVLIKDNQSAIVQSGSMAYRYVNDYGFKLYAKCQNGTLCL